MHLFAKVFEHANFGGQYRWIVENVEYFISNIGFNDQTSSIKVYKGNAYQPGDFIRFFRDKEYRGSYIDLGPGTYPNIHEAPYSFGDAISSAQICPASWNGNNVEDIPVPLIVRLYQDKDFKGEYRDVLQSVNNLNELGFNDKVSSFRVMTGEDYQPGWVCSFYRHQGWTGGMVEAKDNPGSGGFGPNSEVRDLDSYFSFDDQITSIKIHQI